MFARYLLQDSGISYGKLLGKVISCCNNLQEQRTSFYRLAVKVTGEVMVQLVTRKSEKLQPSSYSKLHGASNVIKKWRPHQQVFLNGFVQNVSNA